MDRLDVEDRHGFDGQDQDRQNQDQEQMVIRIISSKDSGFPFIFVSIEWKRSEMCCFKNSYIHTFII